MKQDDSWMRNYNPACFCSKCNGEKDSEGWCANYCMDDDEPQSHNSPELESSTVGYNDRGDPVRRAPLGRVQSEDDQ